MLSIQIKGIALALSPNLISAWLFLIQSLRNYSKDWKELLTMTWSWYQRIKKPISFHTAIQCCYWGLSTKKIMFAKYPKSTVFSFLKLSASIGTHQLVLSSSNFYFSSFFYSWLQLSWFYWLLSYLLSWGLFSLELLSLFF